MFLVLIIQAFIALASVVSSLFDSSLTTYSQPTFGLILDIPTVAYFVTSALESSTVNQTTAVSVVINESTIDTCAWGIPGLLALRPVALPPSVIDVPSRELQLLNASMHALSLIQTDRASYTPLGNYSQDSTLLSSAEPILVRHTLKHRSATPSTALRFYFTIGLFLVGMVIMMLTKIFLSERIPVVVVDLVESTTDEPVYPGSSDSPAKDIQVQAVIPQVVDTSPRRKRNTKSERRAKQKAKRQAEALSASNT